MQTVSQATGDTTVLITALQFSVQKHLKQIGGAASDSVYVRRQVSIAAVLAKVGWVTDVNVLVAAILYDTLEDTQTTQMELIEHFGPEVLDMVQQLSEDRHLAPNERMELQVKQTTTLEPRAKEIRLAEKICALEDLMTGRSAEWPLERKKGFINWLVLVARGCQGVNRELDANFDELLEKVRVNIEPSA